MGLQIIQLSLGWCRLEGGSLPRGGWTARVCVGWNAVSPQWQRVCFRTEGEPTRYKPGHIHGREPCSMQIRDVEEQDQGPGRWALNTSRQHNPCIKKMRKLSAWDCMSPESRSYLSPYDWLLSVVQCTWQLRERSKKSLLLNGLTWTSNESGGSKLLHSGIWRVL